MGGVMGARSWIILLLIVGLGLAAFGCDEGDDGVTPQTTTEFAVGGMLPITGDLSQYADQLQTFMEFGVEDANTALEAAGSDFQISMIFGDSETSGSGTATLAEYMYDINGINCLIGPLTSGEILPLAGSTLLEDIIILSPGSTAPSLATPSDNILRFVTGDSLMATALAQRMWDDGIRAIAAIHRPDTWGEALSALVFESFTGLGGELLGDFENVGTRPSEIEILLDSLSSRISASTLSTSQIAVQITTLEEGLALLIGTSDSLENHPLLAETRWYGSDGLVQNHYMVEDSSINAFAATVQYTAPIYSLESSAELTALNARFAEVSGDEPWTYSYIAYDIVRLVGEALMTVSDPTDVSELEAAITASAATMNGVTGSMSLDSNGDRAQGSYSFWQVVEEGGSYQWVDVTN